MAKVGRPRGDFDWHLVESLAMHEASELFVAERLLAKDNVEINKKTLAAKVKLIQRRILERFDLNYVQYREQKLEGQKIKLRSWQWKAAEKGNVAMLIWLGKQYLAQRERVEQKTEIGFSETNEIRERFDELRDKVINESKVVAVIEPIKKINE